MRTSKWNAAVLMLVIGWAAQAGAAENKSSLAPLTLAPLTPLAQEAPVAPPPVVQIATNAAKPDMVFDGGCTVAQATDNKVGWEGGFYPAGAVGVYFNNVQHIELDTSKARVSILQEPKHGKLTDTGIIGDGPYYEYRANTGYLGSDDATLLIEIGGKNYKVHTKFYVVEKVNDNNFYGWGTPATLCAESQPKRVASLTFKQDINLAQWDDIVQEIARSAADMKVDLYIATASRASLEFDDLRGKVINRTNAAGHGWFIDTIPNEWVAKAGSAATHTRRRSV